MGKLQQGITILEIYHYWNTENCFKEANLFEKS